MVFRGTDAESGAAWLCESHSHASSGLQRQRPPANGPAVEPKKLKFGRIFDASSGVVDILRGIQNVATLIKSAEVCTNRNWADCLRYAPFLLI